MTNLAKIQTSSLNNLQIPYPGIIPRISKHLVPKMLIDALVRRCWGPRSGSRSKKGRPLLLSINSHSCWVLLGICGNLDVGGMELKTRCM